MRTWVVIIVKEVCTSSTQLYTNVDLLRYCANSCQSLWVFGCWNQLFTVLLTAISLCLSVISLLQMQEQKALARRKLIEIFLITFVTNWWCCPEAKTLKWRLFRRAEFRHNVDGDSVMECYGMSAFSESVSLYRRTWWCEY